MTNPLYRYLHKGKRKTSKKRKGGFMTRRKHGFKRGSGGSKVFGLSSKGLLGSFGILGVAGAALTGLGYLATGPSRRYNLAPKVGEDRDLRVPITYSGLEDF